MGAADGGKKHIIRAFNGLLRQRRQSDHREVRLGNHLHAAHLRAAHSAGRGIAACGKLAVDHLGHGGVDAAELLFQIAPHLAVIGNDQLGVVLDGVKQIHHLVAAAAIVTQRQGTHAVHFHGIGVGAPNAPGAQHLGGLLRFTVGIRRQILDVVAIRQTHTDQLVGGSNVATADDQRRMVKQAKLGRVVPHREDALTVGNAADGGRRQLLAQHLHILQLGAVGIGVDGAAGPALQLRQRGMVNGAFGTVAVGPGHIPLGHIEGLAVECGNGQLLQGHPVAVDLLVGAELILLAPAPIVVIQMAVGEIHLHLGVYIVVGVVEEVVAGDGDLHADGAHVITHLPIVSHGDIPLAGGNGVGVMHHIAVHAVVVDAVGIHPILHHLAQHVGIVGVGIVKGITQAENVALVGDLGHNKHGVILVGKLRVGVVVVPELVAELLLQLDHAAVDNREGLGRVAQSVGMQHTVTAFKFAVGHHIHVAVDAVFLQRIDKVIQPIHGGFIQHTGGGEALTLGVGIDIGRVPLRIQLVEAGNVAAGLRQAAGNLFRIVVLREVGAAVEVHAPKAHGSAILKNELLALHLTKAVLARRLLAFKHKGNIHRHGVGIRRHRNIFRHIYLLSEASFRMQNAKFKVQNEPLSTILHYEL